MVCQKVMKVNFTVRHHEQGRQVNPVGYVRTTQKAKFVSKQWKRYQSFKLSVIKAYCDAANKTFRISHKPIRDTSKYYSDIMVYFRNYAHCDPDNVAKAVNDSLFVNDKYVAGSYDYAYDTADPRLEVVIRSADVHK